MFVFLTQDLGKNISSCYCLLCYTDTLISYQQAASLLPALSTPISEATFIKIIIFTFEAVNIHIFSHVYAALI